MVDVNDPCPRWALLQSDMIHPTATVHRGASLGSRVAIGPYASVASGAVIGCNSEIGPYAAVGSAATIGENNYIATGVCIGSPAESDTAGPMSGPIFIGDNNTVREYARIVDGLAPDRATIIGNNNFLMACCSIGGSCRIGNHVVVANGCAIGEEALLEDMVTISGLVRIEAGLHLGRFAMVGGVSHLESDVPPFTVVTGNPAVPRCINYVGLRRSGLTTGPAKNSLRELKRAWHALQRGEKYHAGNAGAQETSLAAELLSFIDRS